MYFIVDPPILYIESPCMLMLSIDGRHFGIYLGMFWMLLMTASSCSCVSIYNLGLSDLISAK